MGQRANLIIIENFTYCLYYSHWCAISLPKDLFWGPEHALNFIKMQKRVDKETGWLDEIWAEGGTVLDLDKKKLLLYGGEELRQDILLRRVYMEALARVWEGWNVKWASEGIADLAEYVGYPKSKVLKQTEGETVIFCPPKEKDWLSIIVSVKFIDGCTRIYPLDGIIEDFLCYGPKLVNIIDRSLGHEELIISEWTSRLPRGGFHIDIVERTLDYWLADDAPGLLMRIKEKWQGWKVNWQIDCFEIHTEKTYGKVVFQNRSLKDIIDELRDILLREESYNPAEGILNLTERISTTDQSIEVNSYALSNPQFDLDKKMREEIFQNAVQGLEQTCG